MDEIISKSLFEFARVKIPDDQIEFTGKTFDCFEIHDNTQNLTEEFLYAHQPLSSEQISIYSTSPEAVGAIDYSVAVSNGFSIIDGPAIVVARKGYAGTMYVVEDAKFIVHEDAYPIKPNPGFLNKINLYWFVGHYSDEFQANRTSFWGIGDFPRERFNNMRITLPKISFQNEVAKLYVEKASILKKLRGFRESALSKIDLLVKRDFLQDRSVFMQSNFHSEKEIA